MLIDENLLYISEEIEHYNNSAKIRPNSILWDNSIEELEELINDTSQERYEISLEIKQALGYIQNMEVYDEAQQMLLGISYSPQLMNLFLQKKNFIDNLIKIRDSKLTESEHKDKGKNYLLESEMKGIIVSKNIHDVFDEYVGLPSRYTKNRNISCPLPGHEEKTASFHIYDKTNSFYCYGCRRGGGIVQFVKHLKGITDKEAFKELFPQR